MARRQEIPIAFQTLYASPLVRVRDYRCCAARCGPGHEEHTSVNDIVLMRRGAFTLHFGRRSETADVNQSIFFSKDSVYRVSHPAEGGDRGTIFVVSPRVLLDIIRQLDPRVDERPERPFKFVRGPCSTAIFWRHRELVQRLQAADAAPLEPLWADVTALQLVADVLEASFSATGDIPKRRRLGTETDHADRVELVKSYLSARLGERITLDEVARAAHISPFHLARVFQRHTGTPVHRYLTQLRLRASLERVASGEDLTSVALDFGFSSHSHFSDLFRREFGQSPSEVRRQSNRRTLREMSKNLKV